MQTLIRDPAHATPMTPENHQFFISLHEQGKLLPPRVPAEVIVNFATRPIKSLSGAFLSWDDARLLY